MREQKGKLEEKGASVQKSVLQNVAKASLWKKPAKDPRGLYSPRGGRRGLNLEQKLGGNNLVMRGGVIAWEKRKQCKQTKPEAV